MINIPFVIIYTKENGREELSREEWASHNVGSLTYHREDGPAIIRDTGDMRWYLDGHAHRTDGPAIVWASHSNPLRSLEVCSWRIEGDQFTKEEYDELIQEVKDMPLVLKLIDPRKWVREYKE